MKVIPRLTVIAVALVLGLGALPQTPRGRADAPDEPEAFIDGCREVIAIFAVPVERVRPHLPPQYQPLPLAPATPDGTTVIVRSFHCNAVSLYGEEIGAVRGGQLIAEVVSPDGTGTVNWYVLFWAGDNPDFNHYLELGTPAFPAYDVPDISCTFTGASGVADPVDCAGSAGAGVYTFSAPAPSPSPFEITALVSDSLVPIDNLQANYWHALAQGEFKLTGSPPGQTFHLGPAEIAVRAEEGSLIAEVLGATTRTADVGLSALISGPYTKTVVKTIAEESDEH
jgi:hypothetical protein